jgi:hypothetical protein
LEKLSTFASQQVRNVLSTKQMLLDALRADHIGGVVATFSPIKAQSGEILTGERIECGLK